MSKNNGQLPAHPTTLSNTGAYDVKTPYGDLPAGESFSFTGVTKREYYAAHSGISLDDANVSLQLRNTMGVEEFAPAVLIPEMVRLRFEYADAMIAAESDQ